MNVILNWVSFQLSQRKGTICKIRKEYIKNIIFRGSNRGIHWRQIHIYYRVFLFYLRPSPMYFPIFSSKIEEFHNRVFMSFINPKFYDAL